MTATLLWLCIWGSLLFSIGMLRGPLITTRGWKIMLLPGFCLDALLRAITCVITATPIRGFSPLGRDQPFIEVGESGIKYLGAPLALVARTVAVIAGAYYLLMDRPDFLESGFALPLLDERSMESGRTSETLSLFQEHFVQLPELLALGNLGSMLLIYALFSYNIAAGLRWPEYVAALATCGSFWLGGVAATWLGLQFGFLSRGWFIHNFYLPEIWSTVSLLILGAGIALTLLAGVRGFRLLTDRGASTP